MRFSLEVLYIYLAIRVYNNKGIPSAVCRVYLTVVSNFRRHCNGRHAVVDILRNTTNQLESNPHSAPFSHSLCPFLDGRSRKKAEG